MHPFLKQDDAGRITIRWMWLLKFLAMYFVVFVIVVWAIDRLKGLPFQIDKFVVLLLSMLGPMAIGFHLAILRAKGRSSRQFSLLTLFLIITAACVFLGATSWQRQSAIRTYTARHRLEVILKGMVGKGIAGVGSTTTVVVKNPGFNDDDLATIIDLQPQLSQIGSPIIFIALEGTQVTDAGISRLAEIDSLEICSLERTSITDASIDTFTKLLKLKNLDVQFTRITDGGLLKLSKSRPKLIILPQGYRRLNKN